MGFNANYTFLQMCAHRNEQHKLGFNHLQENETASGKQVKKLKNVHSAVVILDLVHSKVP